MLTGTSLATRLTIGFTVVIVTMLVATALGMVQVSRIESRLDTINDRNSVIQRYAINFRGSVHDRSIALRDVVLVPDDEVDANVADIERLAADYVDSAGPLATAMEQGTTDELAAYEEINRIETETMPVVDEVIRLRRAGETDAALDLLLADARPLFADWLAAINVLIDLEEDRNGVIGDEVRAIAARYSLQTAVLVAISLLLAALVARRITASVVAPIAATGEVLRRVARGDLTARVADADADSDDEVSRLGADANRAVERFAQVVGDMRAGAVSLRGSRATIDEIASGISGDSSDSAGTATAVSQAAQTVSDSVSTVATSTDELGTSIQAISRSVSEATQVSHEAVRSADAANETVTHLATSTAEISEIVRLISGIAEQTNLLALNATIEAARAGDTGKGFAVVASEVGDLAQETARATEQVATAIGGLREDADRAVRAIDEIRGVIDRVNGHQAEIATAVEHQTTVSTDIIRSVQVATEGTQPLAGAIADIAHAVETAAAGTTAVAGSITAMSQQFEHAVDGLVVSPVPPPPTTGEGRAGVTAVPERPVGGDDRSGSVRV